MESQFNIQTFVWMDGTGRITIPELVREMMMISGQTKFQLIADKEQMILRKMKE